MPNLIGLGAGVGATALTLALGAAFWPHMDKAQVSGKPTVSQPVFVAAATPPKQPARPVAPAAQAAPAAAPDAALAKLAVALKSESTTIAAADVGATRSLAFTTLARPPASPALASEAARRLCAQGLVALASGDITGARLYLERAAEGGDTRALMALGTSYDPATLARMGALGIKGDPAKAREYYGKALAAGMGAARERIAALSSL
jgi:TPR repeat protein